VECGRCDHLPAKLARELRDAWEHFITGPVAGGGDETDDQVRETVVASWERSRDAGVDRTATCSRPP
jgi:hypothetical protein